MSRPHVNIYVISGHVKRCDGHARRCLDMQKDVMTTKRDVMGAEVDRIVRVQQDGSDSHVRIQGSDTCLLH
jgi:hypothetical protein